MKKVYTFEDGKRNFYSDIIPYGLAIGIKYPAGINT